MLDLSKIDVIAPNFKRRLSGVTSTVVRLVPLQAQHIGIAACAPEMPDSVPNLAWPALLTMSRTGPHGSRVWHARRNVEKIAGLALKHLLRKRLKLLFTSASQRIHKRFTKWLIAQMDAVVSTSAKTAAYLDRESTVIHHGIDCDVFKPTRDRTALRAELGLPSGPLIGCFGRIRAQKGTDVFVDTLIAVLSKRADGSGIILGRAVDKDLAYSQELIKRVADAGLSDRIFFLPEVPVWETPRYYQALDLYIAPQRREGFGLTPLEAMACGVPVIATRVGAFETLVENHQTGRLIPADDLPAMIDAAEFLLSDPTILAEWSKNARAHVIAGFQLKHEAEALTAIYRDLLN